jgi:putative oxidoreductase
MYTFNRFIECLKQPATASLLLRIALGVVFIMNGWFKIAMGDFVIQGFAAIGIPAFLTYIVMYAEFVGGIALLVGIFVRPVALLLAFIMLVATVKVHLPMGFSMANGGYEYTLTLMLALLALASLGAGKYSLSRLIKRKR